ncbi:MAG: HAD family hydrolase [Clostridia bacterium]|nr:HAD family hydrolase [Clostridia bacterium]
MNLSQRYDYVLFDLDGTLTDPKIGITSSVQYALAAFGIHEPCLDNLVKFIGPPLKDSFREFYGFSEDQADKAVAKYREYFADRGLYENEAFPDIPHMLDHLLKCGKTLAVATSKPTYFAEKILEYFHLKEKFSFVGGSNLDGTRMKKAEVISFVLEEMGISELNRVIMVGDRKHDVIGAQETGIDSIGVLYGYGSREEMEKAKPTYSVETVKDLEALFKDFS